MMLLLSCKIEPQDWNSWGILNSYKKKIARNFINDVETPNFQIWLSKVKIHLSKIKLGFDWLILPKVL